MSINSWEQHQPDIDLLNNALLQDSSWQVALRVGQDSQHNVLDIYCVQTGAHQSIRHTLLGNMPLGILPGHLLACFDIAARFYHLGLAHGRTGEDGVEQIPHFISD